MIPDRERNEIINLLIVKLDSSVLEFPYSEIKQKYNVSQLTLMAEILKELSSEEIIRVSGTNFHSGRLLANGLEIKRNDGWLRTLELIEKDNEKKRIRDEVELDNLRHSTILSKRQIKWFNFSLLVGFIGGLSGLVALYLELNEPWTKNYFEQNPVKKVEDVKLRSDSLIILDTAEDSLKNREEKNAR